MLLRRERSRADGQVCERSRTLVQKGLEKIFLQGKFSRSSRRPSLGSSGCCCTSSPKFIHMTPLCQIRRAGRRYFELLDGRGWVFDWSRCLAWMPGFREHVKTRLDLGPRSTASESSWWSCFDFYTSCTLGFTLELLIDCCSFCWRPLSQG